MEAKTEKATFGAGCFWGTQKFFKKQFKDAIVKSEVGYAGGSRSSPSYQEVCTGDTGHAEALHIEFDPSKVKYEDLVEFFFRMHDPTTKNRQGNDIGTQYRSVIFFHSPEQEEKAKAVLEKVKSRYRNPITTEIVPFTNFFRAEEYHQDYLEKNPGGYCNHYLRW